jgi:hypothetical protein
MMTREALMQPNAALKEGKYGLRAMKLYDAVTT